MHTLYPLRRISITEKGCTYALWRHADMIRVNSCKTVKVVYDDKFVICYAICVLGNAHTFWSCPGANLHSIKRNNMCSALQVASSNPLQGLWNSSIFEMRVACRMCDFLVSNRRPRRLKPHNIKFRSSSFTFFRHRTTILTDATRGAMA
jgi:hypothetical protein